MSVLYNFEYIKNYIEINNLTINNISLTFLGDIFQNSLDEKERHDFGIHYTSEDNILKVINPLFMDELWKEFEEVKTIPVLLDSFHKKISSLKFLDPACGCGNFLIIAYRELCNLEYELLRYTKEHNNFKVSINQFYGIEIEESSALLAQLGL